MGIAGVVVAGLKAGKNGGNGEKCGAVWRRRRKGRRGQLVGEEGGLSVLTAGEGEELSMGGLERRRQVRLKNGGWL